MDVVTAVGGHQTCGFVLRVEDDGLTYWRRRPYTPLIVTCQRPYIFCRERPVIYCIPFPPLGIRQVVEPLIVGSCPHAAHAVAYQSHDGDAGQGRLHHAAILVLYIHTVTVGTHPQVSLRVVGHRQNIATHAAVRLHDTVSLAGVRNARLQMTHPDSTVAVGGQTGHIVRCQRLQPLMFVAHGSDDARILMIGKQSLVVSGNPDVSPSVVHHVANGVVLRGEGCLWQTDRLSHLPSSHDVAADVLLARTIYP